MGTQKMVYYEDSVFELVLGGLGTNPSLTLKLICESGITDILGWGEAKWKRSGCEQSL